MVAVPHADMEEVLAAARALRNKEEATFRAIAEGNLDRRWINETLLARGCEMP